MLYHDTCLLWAPIFHKLFKINIDTPCYVFSKQASKPLDPIKLPTNYTIDSLKASDVETVVTKNKIAYEPRYVQDCFRISSAIRTGDGELVAWGMTHRDCKVYKPRIFNSTGYWCSLNSVYWRLACLARAPSSRISRDFGHGFVQTVCQFLQGPTANGTFGSTLRWCLCRDVQWC